MVIRLLQIGENSRSSYNLTLTTDLSCKITKKCRKRNSVGEKCVPLSNKNTIKNMKKLLSFFAVLAVSATAFAFESYKDSTVLTGADMAAVRSNINGYQNYIITDARGFEYSGFVLINDNKFGQYLQLSNYTNVSPSQLTLPDVGFPIESVSLDVSYTTGEDKPIANRNIYLMAAPSANHNDTVNALAKCNIGAEGTRHIDLVVASPKETQATLQMCKNGMAIWKITIRWTVTGELACKSLSIVPQTLTVCEGQKDALHLKTQPANASEPISWKSLNEAIATVDNNGEVTATGVGEAKIVAFTASNITDTAIVTVRPKATAISICADSEAIDTLYMYADATGSVYDVEIFGVIFEPDGAFVETISWQTTDDKVVTIDQTGYAVAQNPGNAKIIAISASGLRDTCEIVVKGKLMPEQVIIDHQTLQLEKGGYITLTATVLPDDLEEDLKDVNWESLNERVATVSARGYVQAVGSGTTYIVASTYNGLSDSCLVTVGGTAITGEYYVKVTKELDNWNGRYLIVCEQKNVALNGGLDEYDVTANTIEVSIADEAIAADNKTNAASFDIFKVGEKYSIRGASGKYIGYNAAETEYQNKNGIQTSDTRLLNQIALDNLDTKIVGEDGSQLMFNTDETASGRTLLFRYYANPAAVETLAPIQLYRYVGDNTALEMVEIEGLCARQGRIVCDGEFQIFDLLGRDVTRLNGSLNGVYIVKAGDKTQKIAVR